MRDPRSPTIILCKKLPDNSGKFLVALRIELYPATQWSDKFGPNSPKRKDCAFYRRPPFSAWDEVNLLKSSDASKYYRIMVNERWYSENDKQYEFYSETKAYDLLKEL